MLKDITPSFIAIKCVECFHGMTVLPKTQPRITIINGAMLAAIFGFFKPSTPHRYIIKILDHENIPLDTEIIFSFCSRKQDMAFFPFFMTIWAHFVFSKPHNIELNSLALKTYP